MEIAFRTFTTMPSLCIDLRSASSLDHKIIKGDYVGMRKVICCRKLYDKCRHYTFISPVYYNAVILRISTCIRDNESYIKEYQKDYVTVKSLTPEVYFTSFNLHCILSPLPYIMFNHDLVVYRLDNATYFTKRKAH